MSTLAEVKRQAENIQVKKSDMDPKVLESVLLGGDLGKLTPDGRVMYYAKVCESVGLNPLTKPFDYIVLNGKLTLYARKDCTQQLCSIHKISTEITNREKIDDVYVVSARAAMNGRISDDDGAVDIKGLFGDKLCNAMMKAVTKAKRRAVLGICGLGIIDESELETIQEEVKPFVDSHQTQATIEPVNASIDTDPITTTIVRESTESKDISNTPVNGVCSEFVGLVTSVRVKSGAGKNKDKEITYYTAEDSSGQSYVIQKWGGSKDGATNSLCKFLDIKVGEFRGERQYMAQDIIVENNQKALLSTNDIRRWEE